MEATKSSAVVTPIVPPPSLTSAPISTISQIGDLESAVETALESTEFAAVAAEEGVDLATARRLVRAVLKVVPDSEESSAPIEVDSQLQDYI